MNEIPTADEFALQAVPENARRGSIGLAATTAAWIITMSTLYTGAVLAGGLTFWEMLTVAGSGMLLLGVIAFFQSYGGARYGVTTTILADRVFGVWVGKSIAVGIAFMLGVGWFGWQLAFFGETVSAYWGDHFLGQSRIAIIWGATLIALTTIVGYRALSTLSLFAVPLIVVLSLWGIAMAISKAGGWALISTAVPSAERLTLWEGIGLVVGNGIIGALVMPDLARFGRSPIVSSFASSGGYVFGGLFLIVCGGLITYAMGRSDGDLPGAMRDIGFGFFGFTILLLAQWTTNNNNLYSGSLAFTSVVGGKKSIVIVGMTALGVIIALAGIHDVFVPFLLTLGIAVAPITGVMIAEYWKCRTHLPEALLARRSRRYDIAAILSVCIGVVAALSVPVLPPPLTGILTSFLVHALFSRAEQKGLVG